MLISFDLDNATLETLYLMSIPGLYEDLIEGLKTPPEDCIPHSDMWWTHYE